MVKKHLKRLAAPKSWQLKRKQKKFTTRPMPTGQGLKFSISARTILRDLLGYASTAKQAKKIIINNPVLIDGKRIKDDKRAAGLMDIISIPKLNENFKVMINTKGKLVLKKISEEEAREKTCKITGKRTAKGNKMQLTLHDGRTVITDRKEYNIRDSLEITIPEQKIIKHLKLEKGASVYLLGGKHSGLTGTVEKMEHGRMLVKFENGVSEVKKDFAFVIKDK